LKEEQKDFFYKLNAKENEFVEAEWENKNKQILKARAQERKYSGADIKPLGDITKQKQEKEDKYFDPIFWYELSLSYLVLISTFFHCLQIKKFSLNVSQIIKLCVCSYCSFCFTYC
jgi:hypothetical protein